MTPEQFCYWLNGALELRSTEEGLNVAQLRVVREHLALVLTKVTKEKVPERLVPVPPPTSTSSTRIC